MSATEDLKEIKFRDQAVAEKLVETMNRLVREIGRDPIVLMHVCGSHEQAIAKFGLRARMPKELDVIMGPGCPVCVTDTIEVDEGVALARQGVEISTYGDMLRVPGSSASLADMQREGHKVHVVYSATQAVQLARKNPDKQHVFFATGFETTAVSTAAVLLDNPPDNFSILSAHKYVPAAMELVANSELRYIEGFLAAGHAATITGWGIFEEMAAHHKIPISVAGFEPLDILAGMVELLQLVRDGEAKVVNAYPRCVTKEGNVNAQKLLWRVFQTSGGYWRGIADVPDGSLRLREEFAKYDARRRFTIDPATYVDVADTVASQCICGTIMQGKAKPDDCPLYKKECTPDQPVGACMVSAEGTCKIWYEYGGRPDLGA